MTQKDALTILKTGKNVFLTGPAGSGKTYVLNQYIKFLREHNVPIGITASTGIAATHMGGVTIHSWTGIGVKDRLSLEDIQEISEKGYIKNKVYEAKVLIIDEVSMLHHFRLDMVDRVLKHIKRSTEPFGGMQIVLCGDFFQLPPVSRMGEPEANFIYKSMSWKEGNFAVCYLHENYRQNDDPILLILNEIRAGKIGDKSRNLLKERHIKGATSFDDEIVSDEKFIDTNNYETVLEVGNGRDVSTRLYTHNIDVDRVNDVELNKVVNNEVIYEMIGRGKKPLVDTLKKTCLAPEFLRLRKGARVMCVKNNFDQGYVNGTLGVVVSCAFGSDPVIRTASTPDFPEGRLITISKATWTIADGEKVLAEIEQYPLRLAWAITVHKSQGMSLDSVEVDLSKAFEAGMGYVALSRVRTLNGLKILGFSENALRINADVLEHDRHLRELSNKAESVVMYTDEKEIIASQNEFLARVAPLHALDKKGKKMKKVKVSTYDITADLVRAKKSIREIAKERDLEEETIINQIENSIQNVKGVTKPLSMSDISYLRNEISPLHFKKIEKVLEEVYNKGAEGETPLLSPVKSKLGSNVSWKEIKLARLLLGYIRKND